MIYKISTLFDWLIPTIPKFENFDCQEGGQAELQGRGGQLLAHEELLRLLDGVGGQQHPVQDLRCQCAWERPARNRKADEENLMVRPTFIAGRKSR